jgi:F-type H+-transporting ATPase subunit delta
MPHIISPLATRYAQAVAAQVRGANTLGDLVAASAPVQAVLENDVNLAKRLASLPGGAQGRALAASQMAGILGWPLVLQNLLGLLARNNRLALLPQVLAALQNLHDAATGTVRVEITCAAPLSPAQTEAVHALVKQHTAAKQVVVSTALNTQLLAGFTAQFAGRVLNATLRQQLAQVAARWRTPAAPV